MGKSPLKAEDYLGTDNYGNIYFFEKNIFHKKGADNSYHFNDLQLGKPTSADILNPLKIVLFYEAMNTVVFLDRHLIEISRINFNTLPKLRSLGFATLAGGGNLWTFNIGSKSLEVFDFSKKKLRARSQPLGDRVIDQKSNFNFCWLLTSKNLKQYNSSGSLIRSYSNENFTELTENNKNLVAKKENELFFMEAGTEQFLKLALPEMEIQNFYLNDENLYIYDGNHIYSYQIKLTN